MTRTMLIAVIVTGVFSESAVLAQIGSESTQRPVGRAAWPGPAQRSQQQQQQQQQSPPPQSSVVGSPASRGVIRRVSQFATAPPMAGGYASSDSLPPPGPVILGPQPARMEDLSLIYVSLPEPPEIQKHDLISITVDEKSEIIMNSKYNRQRNAKLVAQLKEFMRISDGDLASAALTAPKIDGQLQGQLNSTGQLTDSEGIKYRIAATVTDVLPNGVLRIEARKQLRTADDSSVYTLTGDLRAQDVAADNTASSENIANLQITKSQSGRIYDATKRNWGVRLYDLLFPF